jgi:hypothetical protein
MDPRDDLESLAGGVDCAACGEIVPTGRIRILARRDDIVFVEVACPACQSEALGIVIAEGADADDPDLPHDGDAVAGGGRGRYGEFGPGDIERFREARPIAAADVEVVRQLLASGGLTALVGRTEPPASGPTR